MTGSKKEELEAQLEEIQRQNEQLRNENDFFESYLKRNAQSPNAIEEDDKNNSKNVKNRTQRNGGIRNQKIQTMLTIEQKNEIASSELEEIQKEIEETKRSSERLIDTLRAVIEETDIRISELKKEAYEFKRDIVVGAENCRTGKTMAEKLIRYMEERLRQKDSIIEKLRLKNTTLKSQIQKIDNQLRQKEEMGDTLHYIDFHQLQIENKQYVSKIEGKNEELLKLKMTTGNTVQILNDLKHKLNKLMDESTWLKKEIQTRTELNEKINIDITKTTENILTENKINIKLNSTSGKSVEMPQILDYVCQKAQMYELQEDIRTYERKVEIAQMQLKQKKSKCK